nr:molybdopterin cofactor-binding domain-containing protein [uncultured Limnohabitans sp.]
MQRRQFLQAGSGLVVSFSFAVPSLGLAQADASAKSMVKTQVAAWLGVGADGRVTVYSGKVDLGTGVRTALMQMVAEELDVNFNRIDMVMGDTLTTLDQGQSAGSLSLQNGGSTLRQAAASARQALLASAAARWQVNASDLVVSDGVIATRLGDQKISYAALLNGAPFNVPLDPKAPLKAYADHKIVGKSVARVDIPDKLLGKFPYVHDFKLPGMLHARMVRPTGLGGKLLSVDDSAARRVTGFVKVVRKQDFLAVVCKTEWAAVKAARALKTQWDTPNTMPEQAKLYDYWRQLPVGKNEAVIKTGDIANGLAGSAKRIKATYDFAPHTHGSIGPSCAVADVKDGSCTVWSASQATHSLQSELATVLDMPKARIRLVYLDGAGCYGRNGHEDCSADAALVSQLVGAPVRVQWMRADEHGWDPKSPPTLVDLEGGLDADGKPVAWRSEFFIAQAKGTLEEFPLLAAVLSGVRRTGYYTGNLQKNADVLYQFPHIQTEVHRLADTAFRTSHVRTPGRMQNTFANESFFDELAAAAGADPLAWRVNLLKEPRAKAVLEDVARLSQWQSRPSPISQNKGNLVRGRGVSFVKYDNDRTFVALVAEVEVNRSTGAIRVTDVWCSHDCGQIVNPDGAINQIEGGIVQTISRTLLEELKFDQTHVTSTDWASYPILRFPEVPRIHVSLINRPDMPLWGAGEMAPTVVPSAISNAVFDATGVRLRSVPFLPAKVKAAGVA